MRLGEVLRGVTLASSLSKEAEALEVSGLEYDSRKVKPGSAFFALRGAKADGRMFAKAAMDAGAVAVIAEQEPLEGFAGTWVQVVDERRALALSAKNFYHAIDEQLTLIGVTGTNGKTTTSYLVDALLRSLGLTTALVGTIEYRVGDEKLHAVNTTPESLELYRVMDRLRAIGGTHLTMEVSSHALAIGRVFGVHYRGAIFTNLTQDHLDYHGTMERYFDAKSLLFTGNSLEFAVLNRDDEWSRKIKTGEQAKVWWYGREEDAGVERMVTATAIDADLTGLRFVVKHPGGETRIESPLIGQVNVYNLLAAFCVGLAVGIAPALIAEGLQQCARVPGRLEPVMAGQPFAVLVDYAHTDDALRKTLRAVRQLRPKRILTVFGCGGDRDRTKRPLMGAAAGEESDFVVVTSDNPRSEEPMSIINDALVGLQRTEAAYAIEADRAVAIKKALARAEAGDLVLIAGKGHEDYQIIGSQVLPFDDRREAARALKQLGYGGAA